MLSFHKAKLQLSTHVFYCNQFLTILLNICYNITRSLFCYFEVRLLQFFFYGHVCQAGQRLTLVQKCSCTNDIHFCYHPQETSITQTIISNYFCLENISLIFIKILTNLPCSYVWITVVSLYRKKFHIKCLEQLLSSTLKDYLHGKMVFLLYNT